MIDQVTCTERIFSTSISQREVIQAHGQTGSNHISADAGAAADPELSVTMTPNLRYGARAYLA
ncbi:hypothetical protein GCM10009811_36570 [Nostocoides veronense]|uniref:Uncharacterized protein n=1 Tax=Nostocoides veronense TaxID=330836 RepID=A0ABN2M5C2_9MICO